MCRQNDRIAAIGACALALLLPAKAFAADPAATATKDDAPPDRKVAIGFRLGFIPPVFAVVELLVRPIPHLAVGVFGITTESGPENGGRRYNLGGEVEYEFREGRRNTPYVAFAYDYYHADPDANGFSETSTMVTLTAGYTVKKGILELTFGGGLMFIITDAVPCTVSCPDVPTGLPAIDLAVRLAPF